MYGMDHCAAHEIALDDVTEEFEMVVRSPKPWIPSDAASKKSTTKSKYVLLKKTLTMYSIPVLLTRTFCFYNYNNSRFK